MTVLERITAACEAGSWTEVPERDGTPTFEVAREHVAAFLGALRTTCGFETNTFVTAIDRAPIAERFEVTWQFLSMEHNDRIRVRCRVTADDPTVPSCVQWWPGAAFSERECFDMFGVVFEGNPDLRRLLMPQSFPHHPLRKEFPHHGIEPDRLYREWDRARRAKAAEEEAAR